MKGAVVIVVLALLTALTTHHPYNPAYKPNGDSVNKQSNKDLTRRPLASWQEYAAGLMQGKKPPEVSPTDPPSMFIIDNSTLATNILNSCRLKELQTV